MAKPKIDRDRVRRMLLTGFTEQQIADRLRCSVRSVFRIAGDLRIEPSRTFKNITPEIEHKIWCDMAKIGIPQSRIAYQFGVTAAAVNKAIKKQEARHDAAN